MVALFVAVFAIHFLTPVAIQGDSRWTVPAALSLLREGNPDLREYSAEIEASGFYAVECVQPNHARLFPISRLAECSGGRLYNFHPIAVAVLTAPFVWGLEHTLHVVQPVLRPLAARTSKPLVRAFLNGDIDHSTAIAEKFVSSTFVALASVLLYLAAQSLLPRRITLCMALQFAFGTLAWSVVSRALWQHSPSILINSAILFVLTRTATRPWIISAGALFALNFFVRPTNIIPAAVFGAWLLWRYHARALWTFAGAIPVIATFVAINAAMYGTLLAPYFLPVRQGTTSLALHSDIAQAIAANLISPARGLLVYTPFLLMLAVPAAWRAPVDDRLRAWRPLLASVAAAQLLLVSVHQDWWGGFSYGPRYLSDVLPYLMLLWAPALQAALERRPLLALYAGLALCSLFINARGAIFIAPHHWNSTPVSINDNPARVWDWRDPPFLR